MEDVIPSSERAEFPTTDFNQETRIFPEIHQTTEEDESAVSTGLDKKTFGIISIGDVLATIQEMDSVTKIEIVVDGLEDWIWSPWKKNMAPVP